MSKTITRQLDALVVFSKADTGALTLMPGMRGAVWIMSDDKLIIDVRVWDRLWELGDLEHITYDPGHGKRLIKRLKITEQGLQRLWDSGEES